MKTNILNNIRKCQYVSRTSMMGLSVALTCIACEKSEDNRGTEIGIQVSATGHFDEWINELDLPVEGGKDTIYVFSSSDILMAIQPPASEEWVKVSEEKYMPDLQATRIILEVEPLEDNLDRRVSTLNISNQEPYSRKFLKMTQGYGARYTNDFSWLRYGNGNPQQANGVLIAQWNPTQQQQGWTSTILEGQTQAFVYGKNDYVQIGSETTGANLLTPIISGVERDSLLVLTFNAVSFVSEEGEPDNTKLTIKLTGGEFEEGEVSHVLDIPHFDKESALMTSKMWENTWFKLDIRKPQSNPTSSTMQVEFINGAGTGTAKNRVFLDNVKLYTKARFEQENR
ncbi:hypothetical protein [Sphingobacterium chuzhouense]|uniref:DUF5689 domain-containing protein n=1 Tax=Sphingobacterium chuzhouense TaxID=1742264 RepID=A0ABR7XW42_9SPHI|nr:hypothetical protein [Sphingobacterium chuzhouense]MBD1423279.1 hypothetical protein [Sphingobacterium chuzhouense]